MLPRESTCLTHSSFVTVTDANQIINSHLNPKVLAFRADKNREGNAQPPRRIYIDNKKYVNTIEVVIVVRGT